MYNQLITRVFNSFNIRKKKSTLLKKIITSASWNQLQILNCENNRQSYFTQTLSCYNPLDRRMCFISFCFSLLMLKYSWMILKSLHFIDHGQPNWEEVRLPSLQRLKPLQSVDRIELQVAKGRKEGTMGSSPVRSSLFLEYLHVRLCMLEDQCSTGTDRIDTQRWTGR